MQGSWKQSSMETRASALHSLAWVFYVVWIQDKHGVRLGKTGDTASLVDLFYLPMVGMPLWLDVLDAEGKLLLLYCRWRCQLPHMRTNKGSASSKDLDFIVTLGFWPPPTLCGLVWIIRNTLKQGTVHHDCGRWVTLPQWIHYQSHKYS